MILNPSSFLPLAVEIPIYFQMYPPKVSKLNHAADNVNMDYNFFFQFCIDFDSIICSSTTNRLNKRKLMETCCIFCVTKVYLQMDKHCR